MRKFDKETKKRLNIVIAVAFLFGLLMGVAGGMIAGHEMAQETVENFAASISVKSVVVEFNETRLAEEAVRQWQEVQAREASDAG